MDQKFKSCSYILYSVYLAIVFIYFIFYIKEYPIICVGLVMLVISSLSQALAPYLFGSVIDLSVKNVTLWYVDISVLDTIIYIQYNLLLLVTFLVLKLIAEGAMLRQQRAIVTYVSWTNMYFIG